MFQNNTSNNNTSIPLPVIESLLYTRHHASIWWYLTLTCVWSLYPHNKSMKLVILYSTFTDETSVNKLQFAKDDLNNK